jgi:hypothetical protein
MAATVPRPYGEATVPCTKIKTGKQTEGKLFFAVSDPALVEAGMTITKPSLPLRGSDAHHS